MEQFRTQLKAFEDRQDEHGKKLDRVLDLLQGPDPLNNPGSGLVADVHALKAERRDRDALIRKMKALGWSGAAAGLGALVITGIEWIKAHTK